jgi:hypothetical protein
VTLQTRFGIASPRRRGRWGGCRRQGLDADTWVPNDGGVRQAERFGRRTGAGPCQLIMVVIPQKPSDLYREAKFLSDVKIGVPSQCVVARNAGIGCMPKRRDQYCGNLVLKINAKLGAPFPSQLFFSCRRAPCGVPYRCVRTPCLSRHHEGAPSHLTSPAGCRHLAASFFLRLTLTSHGLLAHRRHQRCDQGGEVGVRHGPAERAVVVCDAAVHGVRCGCHAPRCRLARAVCGGRCGLAH